MTYEEAFTKLVEQIKSMYEDHYDWSSVKECTFFMHRGKEKACLELLVLSDQLKQSVDE